MTLPPYRLLHVEDDPTDARVFGMMLDELEVPPELVHRVSTLAAAVSHLRANPVDIVFLDLDLPDSVGLDSVTRLRACGVHVPVVVLTGHGNDELGLQAVASGAQDYLVKDDVHANVLARVMRFAVERHGVTTREQRHTAEMTSEARDAATAEAHEMLEGTYEGAIEGWTKVLELRDGDTMGHSRRATEQALAVAEHLGLDADQIDRLRRGALLHDIGKIAVPDAILWKRGPLDATERNTMERHTVVARDLLENIEFLRTALDVPYAHHERWDGSGYPRGLVGDDIPLVARIFAVVDVYDALTRDRPYRTAWSREDARAYIEAEAGRLFDPDVVAAFMTIDT